MWLPKDEGKTLRKYHSYIQKINQPMRFINLSDRAYDATKNLMERGLIREIKEEGKESSDYITTWLTEEPVSLRNFLSFPEEGEVEQEATLEFTLKGLDLAGVYDSKWLCIKLWYEKYIKNHPILLMLSFLVGILITLLVNWLSGMFR